MFRQHDHGPQDRSTNIHKLLGVLSDHDWHATRELSRRVGHTFAVAKFKLVHYGYVIEKERHPTKRFQWRYRLLDAPKNG